MAAVQREEVNTTSSSLCQLRPLSTNHVMAQSQYYLLSPFVVGKIIVLNNNLKQPEETEGDEGSVKTG